MNMIRQFSGKETKAQVDMERLQRKERLEHNLADIGMTIMVLSGKGGVGKSTIAANLALGLAANGYQVGLLDMDIHGPSIPRILGIQGHSEGTAEGRMIMPLDYNPNLKVMSIETMLRDRDASLIWRGPMKIRAIKQFLADVLWGKLDYLVIDSPPGTGDEPLTIAQTIEGATALIVTTPQELALADVRKAIDFCHRLDMPILGLVENFSSQICPHCGKPIKVFGQGGGKITAKRYGLRFLGEIPWDDRLLAAEDAGLPMEAENDEKGAMPALHALTQQIIKDRFKSKPEWLNHRVWVGI
jgi:ATP-binding protein involved in chromosome partitioning